MSEETTGRVPKRRPAQPRSPALKRERFAQLLDALLAFYEGMGNVDAAQVLWEHREALLDTPAVLELLEKFSPDLPEEKLRELGQDFVKVLDGIIPKPAPINIPGSPCIQSCGRCNTEFDIYGEGVRLESDGLTFTFAVHPWLNKDASGIPPNGFICPRCTLKLCREVGVQYEKEGTA